MADILADIHKVTGGMPYRVGQSLFVDDGEVVHWLSDVSDVFGWLGCESKVPPRFHTEAGYHTKAEVVAELRRTAEPYLAVETLPHEPPMRGHYYACGRVNAGDGRALNRLAQRFCPATDIDATLIRAMLVTPFWGGPCGSRPAFLVTSDHGRGTGKSTLARIVSQLAGGAVEVHEREDFSKLKSRLLSPEGITKRVLILDNVKSCKFSWDELEGLITTPTISGHRYYSGEGQRPNTLTTIITLNGANLSKDLSQRCVPIKLSRPHYSAAWEEQTASFIETHARQLVADIVGVLRSKPHKVEQFTRWARWEREVLGCIGDPTDAQRVIADRQSDIDVEHDEAAATLDGFRDRLAQSGYDTAHERVFVPSEIAAAWYNAIHGTQKSTTSVGRILNPGIRDGSLKRLAENRTNAWGRGVVWVGELAGAETGVLTDLRSRVA